MTDKELCDLLRANIPYEAPRCLEAADRIEALNAEVARLRNDHASAVAELRKTKALLKGYRRGYKTARAAAPALMEEGAAPALMEEGARLALEAATYIASKEAQGWLKIGTSAGASNMTAAKYKARHQAGGEIVAKIRALDPATIVKGAGRDRD